MLCLEMLLKFLTTLMLKDKSKLLTGSLRVNGAMFSIWTLLLKVASKVVQTRHSEVMFINSTSILEKDISYHFRMPQDTT